VPRTALLHNGFPKRRCRRTTDPPSNAAFCRRHLLPAAMWLRITIRRALLSHFLLHCDSGLKVAQIARLVASARPRPRQVLPRRRSKRTAPPYAGGPTASCRAMPAHRRVILTHARPVATTILRLHRAHLGRARLHSGLAPFCKKFGLGSGHAGPQRQPRSERREAYARRAAPHRNGRRANPCPCRLPLFRHAYANAGAFLLMPSGVNLGWPRPGMFRGRVRLLAAGPVDQRLLVGGRHGTRLPSDEMEDAGFGPA